MFECNYDVGEADVCNMEQQTDDEFDWTWTSSSTPGDNTGPTTAQTLYGYIFANSQAREAGDVAKCVQPKFTF